MNSEQKKFYNIWLRKWKVRKPIKLNGNTGYLYVYLFELLKNIKEDKKTILNELFLLEEVYREEDNLTELIYSWICSLLFFEDRYYGLIGYLKHYVYRKLHEEEDTIIYINWILSLKYNLKIPITGYDIYKISKKNKN